MTYDVSQGARIAESNEETSRRRRPGTVKSCATGCFFSFPRFARQRTPGRFAAVSWIFAMLSAPPGTVVDELNLSPLRKVIRFER